MVGAAATEVGTAIHNLPIIGVPAAVPYRQQGRREGSPMNSLTGLVVTLLMAVVFFYVLFLVVRTAVKEGVQMALRTDLLDQRARGSTDAS